MTIQNNNNQHLICTCLMCNTSGVEMSEKKTIYLVVSVSSSIVLVIEQQIIERRSGFTPSSFRLSGAVGQQPGCVG